MCQELIVEIQGEHFPRCKENFHVKSRRKWGSSVGWKAREVESGAREAKVPSRCVRTRVLEGARNGGGG